MRLDLHQFSRTKLMRDLMIYGCEILQFIPLSFLSDAVTSELELSASPEWFPLIWAPPRNPLNHWFAAAVRAFQLIGWRWFSAFLHAVKWLLKRYASLARALHC